MKNKKLSRFEKLCEAIEEENLFDFGGEDDIIDDYEDNIDDIPGEGEVGDEEVGGEVTLTVSAEQVAVLKDILAQLDGEGEGEEELGDELGGEGEGEVDEEPSDIEELEEEAVEFENAPDAETVKNKTKSGKASTKTGDLEKDSNAEEGPEKPFKFVRKEVPQELKHKTTGTKG